MCSLWQRGSTFVEEDLRACFQPRWIGWSACVRRYRGSCLSSRCRVRRWRMMKRGLRYGPRPTDKMTWNYHFRCMPRNLNLNFIRRARASSKGGINAAETVKGIEDTTRYYFPSILSFSPIPLPTCTCFFFLSFSPFHGGGEIIFPRARSDCIDRGRVDFSDNCGHGDCDV